MVRAHQACSRFIHVSRVVWDYALIGNSLHVCPWMPVIFKSGILHPATTMAVQQWLARTRSYRRIKRSCQLEGLQAWLVEMKAGSPIFCLVLPTTRSYCLMNLHALSQADLLRHFSADFANQTVYTTYSPFMVPTENVDAIHYGSPNAVAAQGFPAAALSIHW